MTAEAPVMTTPLDQPGEAGTTKKESDWSGLLMTRSGFTFYVRPATPADEEPLAEFFTHIGPEDLRFRFLSSIRKVGHDQLERMTNVDHRRTEDFLAFEMDGGPIIASAMLAADEKLERAEVAISVRSDYRNRGIGWTMLKQLAQFAEAKGIKVLESIQSRADHAAIELEREMGFTARPCPGDSSLVILEAKLDGGL